MRLADFVRNGCVLGQQVFRIKGLWPVAIPTNTLAWYPPQKVVKVVVAMRAVTVRPLMRAVHRSCLLCCLGCCHNPPGFLSA